MRSWWMIGVMGCAAGEVTTDDTDQEVSTVEPCQRIPSGYGVDGDESVDVEVVARGLSIPWSVVFPPGERPLVSERAGAIRTIAPDGEVSEPLVQVAITTGGEGGLLGLAVHPQYATNRWLYAYYTADGDNGAVNRVERFVVAEDQASMTSDRIVLDDIPAGLFHNGGRLRFGPDGMLYVGTGDARSPDRSQDVDDPAGKLLRVTDEGEVPDDNPFPGSPTWVYGIRNTQGFDWQDDGRLVLTDHGPSGEFDRTGHDEINVAAPGANLGWPDIYRCQTQPGMQAPSMTWADAMPPGGTAIYTGDEIPAWRGDVFIGVLGFGDDVGHLHRIRLDQAGGVVLSEVYLQGDWGRMRDVIMGPDGGMYVTTSNCDGRSARCGDGDVVLRIGRR